MKGEQGGCGVESGEKVSWGDVYGGAFSASVSSSGSSFLLVLLLLLHLLTSIGLVGGVKWGES